MMKGEGRFFDGQVTATLAISRGFERPMGRRGQDESETIELPEPSEADYAENIAKIMALQVRRSPMPPITMRLVLANHTQQALDVEILEVNSDLGNFAVQPDRLTLPPEKSAEPDAMNSQLGVPGDEIPVKVGLRYAGKTESQIITVKSLFTPEGKKE
jgi:hypothetical protein